MKSFFKRLGARATKFTNTYLKNTSGAKTLIAADANNDRNVIITVKVIETFADGDGAQPTFTIGQTGSATKFSVAGLLTNVKAGNRFVIAGQLSKTDALLVTGTAGTGTTETGAIEVTVAAFPVFD